MLRTFVRLQDQWHGGRMAWGHRTLMDKERQMIGATKAIKVFAVAATVIAALIQPAYSQGFSKKGGGGPPPTENKPKIDEKAYKAALERIPTPDKKYDPWGIARPSEPAGASKKPN
jgi:hypothetical protein